MAANSEEDGNQGNYANEEDENTDETIQDQVSVEEAVA
jgi:hypothetical protein